MGVPNPNVWFPGLGSVPADQFNTYVQVILNYAQLRTFTGQTNMLVNVLGAVSPGDGGQGAYRYDANSTATDNNSSVIVPNGAVQGAWLRVPPVSSASDVAIRYVTTGTADTALNTDDVIIWNSPSLAPKAELLPAPTTSGQQFTIKDGFGNTAQYPITVSASAGTFVGTNVINTPFSALTFTADGVSKWLVTESYPSNTYFVYDATAWGLVGDGTTDNTTLLQAMMMAACSTGGMVRFPPGTFKITSPISGTTIAAGLSLTIVGSGQEVTFILGVATNCFNFNFGNPYCSVNMCDMTFLTTTTGGDRAIEIELTQGIAVSGSSFYMPFSQFERISFRGSDMFAAGTQYWAAGLVTIGVSNVNVIGGGFNGPAASSTGGIAYSFSGVSTIPFYAQNFNMFGVTINTAATGVSYGDWTQAVTLSGCNFNLCAVGIITPNTVTGVPSQMSVVNSMFSCYSYGVQIRTATFNDVQITNSNFVVPANAVGLLLQGSNFSINDNVFEGESTTGSIGIDIPSTYANSGVVNDNWIGGFGIGIRCGAAVTALTLKGNYFVANAGSGTDDYTITGGAAGIVITDDNPRTFAEMPAISSAINFSTFRITDSNTTTFHATITAGGGPATATGTAFVAGSIMIYH